MADEIGLDLVEIAPEANPPVCKIMDFGKYKYEQSKKEKANKAKSKAAEMKEVRLGRSMKIDPHDVDIRIAQARRFLIEGHRVQIIQNFKGREMAFKERGDMRMEDIIHRLADLAKVEVPPRLNGRRMGNGYGVAIWCVLIGGALLKIGYDYVRYGEQRMDLDN
jgi:translation initiation factor IF-3